MRVMNLKKTEQLLGASVIWALALAVLGSADALLYVAPLALLALPLARGRYVGESVISAVRRRAPRPRPVRRIAAPRAALVISARRLNPLSARLAGRAPPAAAIPIS